MPPKRRVEENSDAHFPHYDERHGTLPLLHTPLHWHSSRAIPEAVMLPKWKITIFPAWKCPESRFICVVRWICTFHSLVRSFVIIVFIINMLYECWAMSWINFHVLSSALRAATRVSFEPFPLSMGEKERVLNLCTAYSRAKQFGSQKAINSILMAAHGAVLHTSFDVYVLAHSSALVQIGYRYQAVNTRYTIHNTPHAHRQGTHAMCAVPLKGNHVGCRLEFTIHKKLLQNDTSSEWNSIFQFFSFSAFALRSAFSHCVPCCVSACWTLPSDSLPLYFPFASDGASGTWPYPWRLLFSFYLFVCCIRWVKSLSEVTQLESLR